MIRTLSIHNYALIDHAEIDFGTGLNIITGETGSGKTILLSALGLLMAERADSRSIRNTTEKTIVEAQCDLPDDPTLKQYLTANDLNEQNQDTIILRREITPKGNSRSFINDIPVNLTILKEVSERLVDIHTQNRNSRLADPEYQLQVLDDFAQNHSLLQDYINKYQSYRQAIVKYSKAKQAIEQNRAQEQFITYQLEQLEKVNVKPGELKQLEDERNIQENAQRISALLSSALNSLKDSTSNASTLTASAVTDIRNLAKYLPATADLETRLQGALIEIDDIANTLEDYTQSINPAGKNLEAIEDRLEQIYTLLSRHNVKTDSELIKVHQALKQQLENLDNSDHILHELETAARKAKKDATLAATQLTQARKEAALKLQQTLVDVARPMALTNLQCQITISPVKLSPTGSDQVQFMFSFNKNQPLMPIARNASGGEVARLSLALKTLLVKNMHLPTIIFDEVDTGVSGDVANRMASLMLDISQGTQVITITHLANVAAHGHRHYKVHKQDNGNQTLSMIRQLTPQERETEIATMISGHADASALTLARDLLHTHQTH